jgi:hypothetical protein
MRTYRWLIAAVLAVASWAVCAPASAATPAARVVVFPMASRIYLSDPSPFGPQPGDHLYRTVTVRAVLRNCPAPGFYLRSIDLTQDGITFPWDNPALGASEILCSGTGASAPAGMGFYGDQLHPGWAVVTVAVYDEENGTPITHTRQRVYIPRSHGVLLQVRPTAPISRVRAHPVATRMAP